MPSTPVPIDPKGTTTEISVPSILDQNEGGGGGGGGDCPEGYARHPTTGDCVQITGEGDGGSSGFGGSGGGGGSSAPPDRTLLAMKSLYFEMWGDEPAPGYVEKFRNAGMNLPEFELMERNKPAFFKHWKSRMAEDEATSLITALARFLGAKV